MTSKSIFALNVGGQHYLTTSETLNRVSTSKLAKWFNSNDATNLAMDQKVIKFIECCTINYSKRLNK